MKVHNVSFARTIEIKSKSNSNFQNAYRKPDTATQEIQNVLNGNSSTVYSYEESKRIRQFFRSVLQDYNGANGIIIHKTGNGNVAMLSGQDLRTYKKLNSQATKQVRKSSARFKESGSNQIQSQLDTFVNNKIENGKSNRPETTVYLETTGSNNSSKKVKYDSILYTNFVKEYSHRCDGFIDKKFPLQSHPSKTANCLNVSYEQKELVL